MSTPEEALAKAKRAEQEVGEPRLLEASIFDFSHQATSGGMTGSMRVPLRAEQGEQGHNYQYKSTILQASKRRKLKAGSTDRENFGEVIASKLAMAILNEHSNNNAPDVHLVYDASRKRVNVASRYLDDVRGTLDTYLAEAAHLNNSGKKHVSIISDYVKPYPGAIKASDKAVIPLRESIATAIAASALMGDHDINPGNLMVVGNGEKGVKAVRIDFGHAFNDLLNAPSRLGGKIRDQAHPVLDFFNREKVAGFPTASQSKMWRDYPGLVPSKELAQALQSVATTASEKLINGIENAKQEFGELLEAQLQKQDHAGIIHVFKSLNAICKNFTGDVIEIPSKKQLKKGQVNINDFTKTLTNFFDNIQARSLVNVRDMERTAALMSIQSAIDTLYMKSPSTISIQNEVQALVEKIETEKGIKIEGAIRWVKTDPKREAFVGTVEQYMQQRCEQLSVYKNPAANMDKRLQQYAETTSRQKFHTFRAGFKKIKALTEAVETAKREMEDGDYQSAQETIDQLKQELRDSFGEKKIFGRQSKAFKLIAELEQDIELAKHTRPVLP